MTFLDSRLEDESSIHRLNKGANTLISFVSSTEFPTYSRSIYCCLKNKRHLKVFNRGKVLIENIYINNIIPVLREETNSIT
ncbi:MAG: hypothetical protein EWM72_01703 [Nitrospira sp.]|nr:MAG: hypothetical protein EWM72_01703 [Nitrospira sp.]